MNSKKFYATLGVLLACGYITACTPSWVLTGTRTDAIPPEKVRLYFAERPPCEYERVGYFSVRGGYYSQATLFEAFRQRAASVGADGVYVEELRRLDILEFVGSALAIRCQQEEGFKGF